MSRKRHDAYPSLCNTEDMCRGGSGFICSGLLVNPRAVANRASFLMLGTVLGPYGVVASISGRRFKFTTIVSTKYVAGWLLQLVSDPTS